MKVRIEFSWLSYKIGKDWGSLLRGMLFNSIYFSTTIYLSSVSYSSEECLKINFIIPFIQVGSDGKEGTYI